MKIKKINKEFLLEAQMIPVLIKECCKIFGAKYYIEELSRIVAMSFCEPRS